MHTRNNKFLSYTNFNNTVVTSQRLGSKGFGKGNIDVVIRNCNQVFMRPVVEWFEEVNHVDLNAYKSIKSRKSKFKKHILTTTNPVENNLKSWIKMIFKKN